MGCVCVSIACVVVCLSMTSLQQQAKEQQLREARRALTQATSGLTTSINITSSVAQPGSDTQGTYPAAATGAAGARNRVAAAAARLQSRLAAGAAAESVGGSCHVLHGSGGARTAGGGGGAGAAPQGSVGVSQMRQQLDGMQLQTQDRGSGGGESVGADASVAQQQHEQRVGAGCSNDVGGGAGGDGQLVAAGAVSEAAESVGGAHAVDAVGTSSGRTSPVDEVSWVGYGRRQVLAFVLDSHFPQCQRCRASFRCFEWFYLFLNKNSRVLH